MNYLAIFIGGGLGSLARFAVSSILKKYSLYQLPFGTIASNTFASFLLGFVLAYFMSKNIESNILKNFIAIGFCGGFSTFSTFGFENFSFLQSQMNLHFVAYTILSIVLSILFVFLGYSLATKF